MRLCSGNACPAEVGFTLLWVLFLLVVMGLGLAALADAAKADQQDASGEIDVNLVLAHECSQYLTLKSSRWAARCARVRATRPPA